MKTDCVILGLKWAYADGIRFFFWHGWYAYKFKHIEGMAYYSNEWNCENNGIYVAMTLWHVLSTIILV